MTVKFYLMAMYVLTQLKQVIAKIKSVSHIDRTKLLALDVVILDSFHLVISVSTITSCGSIFLNCIIPS